MAIYIPRALATGKLDLRADARVFEFAMGKDGRARGARYFDADGNTHEVRARQVILAAGTIGSAHLLLLSGRGPDGLSKTRKPVPLGTGLFFW